MIKLLDILLEGTKDIQYNFPNFENEWEEAIRYPEFVNMGKEEWVKIAGRGYSVNYSQVKKYLGNVDVNFNSLDVSKKERFLKDFSSGKIEMPIAVKFSNKDYDLLAGNTRLAGLVNNNIDPKIWIVDLSKK